MTFYFRLQMLRMKRWLSRLGIHPVVAAVVALAIFVGFSILLFQKTEYANLIYLALVAYLLFNLSQSENYKLLRMAFTEKRFVGIRLLENYLLSLLFQLFLLFEKEYMAALCIFPAVICMAFIKKARHWSTTLATPFKKLPFEFIVGFRKTFWLIGCAYFLVVKGVQVDNYNLGLFGLAVIFLTSMSFYQKPEPNFFVWIHTSCSKTFLKKKFVVATICVSMLSAVALFVLVMAFSTQWLMTLVAYFIFVVVLGSMIVAKYSSYPYAMNLPQAIFYAVSFLFPLMLLIAIGVFYVQSKKRLEPILEC